MKDTTKNTIETTIKNTTDKKSASLMLTGLRYTAALLSLALAGIVSLGSPLVRAEDSVVKDVKDAGSDAKTNTKKGVRKAKRKVRKATGNDSVSKDIKDGINDVGDDMSNAAEKAKH